MLRLLPKLIACAVIAGFGPALAPLKCGAATPTPEQTEFFERKIRPVLVAECYECHSGNKSKGGLKLDWRGAVEKGGDTGAAIVPGNAAKSLLIQTIRHEDDDLKMPKNGAKLDDGMIADFVAWVNMGAPDPRDQPPAAILASASTWGATLALRKEWWSFQPPRQHAIPSPANSTWSDHPVDRFLLAKMEARKLQPAGDADARTFIRRLTFALTGLPPTPGEIEAYVRDSTRDPNLAVHELTDRLLDSPRFGEHWARHWMDLMRYAETHGSEGDPEIREAWRYRDYLIRAFNADVPWDRLIREHLAGDLLPDPRWNRAEGFNESILGTASLRLNEHGFQPVDTLDDQVKTIDNQIDVVSKAFQGLTISCARCHDHKFDAISQRDFYALYGIFASSRPAQVIIDAPEKLDEARARLTTLKAKIRAALADAWMAAAQDVPAHLQGNAPGDPASNDLKSRIAESEQRRREIEDAALAQALSLRNGAAASKSLPLPIAQWLFENDARDSIGNLHGELLGGAVVREGRLLLNGTDAYFRTPPLPVTLREKTLEAWASPENLEQRGGGVITLETLNGSIFDSVVLGEKEPRQWLIGSNNFHRTRPLGGPEEASIGGKLVHLAAVFRGDNSIALFRDGAPYGKPYSLDGSNEPLHTFAAGDSRILLGRRHTGGGHPFFAGQIAGARLYDRALSAEEIAASFSAGPTGVTEEEVERVLGPEQREQRTALRRGIDEMRAKLASVAKPKDPWATALQKAEKQEESPLGPWARLHTINGPAFIEGWDRLANKWGDRISELRVENGEQCPTRWDLASGDAAQWFRAGGQLPEKSAEAGEFSIAPSGNRILSGLYPAGVYSHLLSQKLGGLFTSPRFKIETNYISVRALGGAGSMVRLIVDNYPLGVNPIFPKATLENDQPAWVKLDTAYRKGSWAYLEFGTFDDLTRPVVAKGESGPKDGRSYFGVSDVSFHNRPAPPAEEDSKMELLFSGEEPKSAEELAGRYTTMLMEAVGAWRAHRASEPQVAMLDFCIRNELLPAEVSSHPTLAPLVEEYRRIESEIPALRHVPGVIETRGFDAPLLTRGDHTKPADAVPRGYLTALSAGPFHTLLSGRLELANAIADPRNPLTARVMVNRIWHYLFGRGLVPTVDNFGRLGARPTHPELLDFLAERFVNEGWSCKQMIRFLVTSRAYAMGSDASTAARERDPGNELLSHFRVRRLEAESIRDSLLSVSGQLGADMFGPPSSSEDRTRRSIYLAVRRTRLNPFLEIFDAPKPFSTLGRRDATNVPAQSLALLNDPFVINLAGKWANRVLASPSERSNEDRVRSMYEEAFARPPRPEELASVQRYLTARAGDNSAGEERVWQDLAQSLFNLKEFLYLR